MRKESEQVSEFALQPSGALRLGNVLLHLLIASVLIYGLLMRGLAGQANENSGSGWGALGQSSSSLSLLLIVMALLLVLFSAVQRDRRFALAHREAIRLLQYDRHGWQLGASRESLLPIQLTAGCMVTSRFVVLGWRREGSRWPRHLFITPAMLGDADFRRLCRCLWQVDHAASNSEPR